MFKNKTQNLGLVRLFIRILLKQIRRLSKKVTHDVNSCKNFSYNIEIQLYQINYN
jgi:hypothetical protein